MGGGGHALADEAELLVIGLQVVLAGEHDALAAARALAQNTDFSTDVVARKALEIAADICIFTNHNIIVESVGGELV